MDHIYMENYITEMGDNQGIILPKLGIIYVFYHMEDYVTGIGDSHWIK